MALTDFKSYGFLSNNVTILESPNMTINIDKTSFFIIFNMNYKYNKTIVIFAYNFITCLHVRSESPYEG